MIEQKLYINSVSDTGSGEPLVVIFSKWRLCVNYIFVH